MFAFFFNPDYDSLPGKAIHDILFRRIDCRGNPGIPSVFKGYDRHPRVWDIWIDDFRLNNLQCKQLPHLTTNLYGRKNLFCFFV